MFITSVKSIEILIFMKIKRLKERKVYLLLKNKGINSFITD